MPIMIRTLQATILTALLALTGCFSLSRGTPVQQHYILGGANRSETPVPLPVDAVGVVGLRLPTLAAYLASPFVVLRRGENRIEFSDLDRWGEDLAAGLNRSLAARLSALAPTFRIVAAPWPSGIRPDRIVQLNLLRFEGVAPEDPENALMGEAHLLASWEILRAADGTLLARGTTEVRSEGWQVGNFNDLVRLLDDGVGTLAEEIFREIEVIDAREQVAR